MTVTILFVLALLIGFYMLWNIGANDVANAIGTSVGSGSLTLKRAVILAGILEFAGAFLLGSNVTETIQKGIIDPTNFTAMPMIFVLGMLASLFAVAAWLNLATYFKWPVSTTHAIIGAIIGFGLIVGGAESIEWSVVGSIVLSWIISPITSAIVSLIIFSVIQKRILYAMDPVRQAKRLIPLLVFALFLVFFFSSGFNGLRVFNYLVPVHIVILFTVGVSALCGTLAFLLIRGMRKVPKEEYQMLKKSSQQLLHLRRVKKNLFRAKLGAIGENSNLLTQMLEDVDKMIDEIKVENNIESHLAVDYRVVEKMFSYLQVITACFVAFAHGANDVANAIGPVAAVTQVIFHPEKLGMHAQIPLWLLAFGGFGIVCGLAFMGWRVIETIGKKITELTPTRGFSAEFGASTTILIASKIGLPISTTHCIVGAVLGVGLARGITALNVKVLRDIFLSWIITIPSSAITSIVIYYILFWIFGSYQLV